MKRMLFSLFAVSVLLIGVSGSAIAQGQPGVAVGVVVTDTAGSLKEKFQVGEEIMVVISVDNMPEEDETGAKVVTSSRFSTKPFHLLLQFTNPAGELVTAKNLSDTDPPPPLSIPTVIAGTPIVLQAEEVEVLEAGWAIKVNSFNAHDFYDLKKPGNYTVKAAVPLRTYPGVQIIRGKKIAELVDKDFEGIIASKAVGFTIEALVGDYDYDGDVDLNDLNMLLAYKNQPATEHPEYDLNGDGMITARDSRKLMLICTRPRCATE